MSDLELFFVYREVCDTDKWAAVVGDVAVKHLPNISYGAQIYAMNERQAISKAQEQYAEINKNISHQANIKLFMRSVSSNYNAWKNHGTVLDVAKQLAKDYEEYCDEQNTDIRPVEEKA